jgi:hypothetical protein
VTPFDLFTAVPGMSLLRAPARFALLVMMALALLASVGVARRVSGDLHARDTLEGRRTRVGRRAIVLPLGAAILAESYVVNFPSGKPQPFTSPRVYEELATLPAGAVLSLPTYRGTPEAFREADYLLFSTAHWRPIVNGFGRQEPAVHGRRMDVLGRFPSPEALELMRAAGIRYVVLHAGRASELAERATAASVSDELRLISRTGGDFLFTIER